MQGKIKGLLLLSLLSGPAWGATLGSLSGGTSSEAVLSLSVGEATVHPWLVIGPVTGALRVHLTLEGTGFRREADLPLVAGLPVTWSWPLPPGTLRASVTGVWRSSGVALATAPSLASGPGARVSLAGSSARPLFRFELPAFRTAPGYTPQLALEVRSDGPWRVEIAQANRTRAFSVAGGTSVWAYSPEIWGVAPAVVTLSPVANGPAFLPLSVRATGIAADAPLPADTATLLEAEPAQWREPSREWFVWASAPEVMVLVTRTYADQDNYFKRLAFFVEKTGTRGTLVSDEDLAGQHGWNAHDYAAQDLAKFFSLAAARQFRLTRQELELRERLVAARVLVAQPPGWGAGTGAVLGVSAESPAALRAFLFTHEGFHGLYFTSDEFRRGVRDRWNQLSDETKRVFRSFLAYSHYDPADEALMINEFQAYVLQQERGAWSSFFSGRVLARSPALSAAQRLAVVTELLTAAGDLEALVSELFQVSSGSLASVSVLPGTKE